jgi:hypothetical protein
MISPMTSSATERELEKGELKTAIPFLAALSRSTWFVPMQKQPMTRSYTQVVSGRTKLHEAEIASGLTCGFASMTFLVILVLLRIPMAW